MGLGECRWGAPAIAATSPNQIDCGRRQLLVVPSAQRHSMPTF
jgi:hypothetical protein